MKSAAGDSMVAELKEAIINIVNKIEIKDNKISILLKNVGIEYPKEK